MQGLCAVLFAAAVVGARLLPYTVVDVPDRPCWTSTGWR